MYRFRTSCIFVLLFAVSVLCAQEEIPPAGRGGGRGGRGNTREFLGLGPPPDAAAAARGEKLYAPNCAFCHGEKARGGEGPNLVRSVIVLHDEKGESIGPAVLKGFPERGMPAVPQLHGRQLYDIAQFLHLQVELVANRGIYKRLNVVTGDAKGGRGLLQRRRRLQGLPLRHRRPRSHRDQIPARTAADPLRLARRRRLRRRQGSASEGHCHAALRPVRHPAS